MCVALKSICKYLFAPANSTLKEGEARGETQGCEGGAGEDGYLGFQGIGRQTLHPPGSRQYWNWRWQEQWTRERTVASSFWRLHSRGLVTACSGGDLPRKLALHMWRVV